MFVYFVSYWWSQIQVWTLQTLGGQSVLPKNDCQKCLPGWLGSIPLLLLLQLVLLPQLALQLELSDITYVSHNWNIMINILLSIFLFSVQFSRLVSNQQQRDHHYPHHYCYKSWPRTIFLVLTLNSTLFRIDWIYLLFMAPVFIHINLRYIKSWL